MSEAPAETIPAPPAAPTPPVASEAPSAPEAAPQQDVSQLPEWARDALTKANKEAANYRTRLRELEPKAQLADQLEQASKSETQRLQEAAEQSRRDLESARSEALRFRLAAKHGIPEEDFDLLGTGSEDEIEARAQRIATLRAATAPPPPPAGRTSERLRPGATPGDPVSAEDADYQALFGGTT